MSREHRIEIEELVLRVPGVERGEVPTLVDEILRRAQDRLSGTTRAGQVQLAELKVSLAAADRESLVVAVSDALVEAMQ
jgi:hypothetical protein